jgi:hypothetical protein
MITYGTPVLRHPHNSPYWSTQFNDSINLSSQVCGFFQDWISGIQISSSDTCSLKQIVYQICEIHPIFQSFNCCSKFTLRGLCCGEELKQPECSGFELSLDSIFCIKDPLRYIAHTLVKPHQTILPRRTSMVISLQGMVPFTELLVQCSGGNACQHFKT